MRLYLGADHAGYQLKETLKAYLLDEGHDVVDVGAVSEDSVDYPHFAARVGRAVARGDGERGILVCGTGVGMAISANKVRGVRAANVTTAEFARLARAHNNANVVTLAGRYTSADDAKEIVDAFLGTEFEGARHSRRIDAIQQLEDEER